MAAFYFPQSYSVSSLIPQPIATSEKNALKKLLWFQHTTDMFNAYPAVHVTLNATQCNGFVWQGYSGGQAYVFNWRTSVCRSAGRTTYTPSRSRDVMVASH
jgi:hypothetical protein